MRIVPLYVDSLLIHHGHACERLRVFKGNRFLPQEAVKGLP
jgi:hypothetical protein